MMGTIRRVSWAIFGIATAVGLLFLARGAAAYEYYSDSSAPDGIGNCASCHELAIGGFQQRQALHDAHTASATNNCRLCHTSTGDIPRLYISGEIGGVGCIGCHGQPISGTSKAVGLRRHHALAGAPPDSNGQWCSDCHRSDPSPVPESTLPVYYSRADVIQRSPCNTDNKEDFWNRVTGLPDGKGLDNDGDLLYDALTDTDCGASSCHDVDGDGYGDPGDPACPNGAAPDCDDARADVYPGAVEAYDTRDNDCDGEIDEIHDVRFSDPGMPWRLWWDPQPPSGQLCDVIRSDGPRFLPASAQSVCLALATPLDWADDSGLPARDSVFYYLVRNTLVADYGESSDGSPRLYALCP